MKTDEYAKLHGLVSDKDWRNHFRNNLHTGRFPVAMYSCIDCKEILWDFPNTNHKCIKKPIKNKGK